MYRFLQVIVFPNTDSFEHWNYTHKALTGDNPEREQNPETGDYPEQRVWANIYLTKFLILPFSWIIQNHHNTELYRFNHGYSNKQQEEWFDVF